MGFLVSILSSTVLFGFVTILQTTIISRMALINGQLDLILLALVAWLLHEETPHWWLSAIVCGIIAGTASVIPVIWLILIYLLISTIIIQIKIRIWQAPLMKLFVSVLLGSGIFLAFSFSYRLMAGTSMDLLLSINRIILPSLLLNLIFTFPIAFLVQEAANIVYPRKEKI